MRIWSIHPEYLDTKGLVAVWRESLLAQKVLKGETKGYKNHPQLIRFNAQGDPLGAIAAYLRTIYRESVNRGYGFSEDKIDPRGFEDTITCTRGQLLYEWNHLKGKLNLRDPQRLRQIGDIRVPRANPIFTIVDGAIEDWEVIN